MLELFSRHGRFDLTLTCRGDVQVDYHHTVEDIAIVLAPLFRPSTTGVVKDDGGPSSLGDFLNHLTSGKS